MNLEAWPGFLAYIAIFLAAAIEGEVIFVAASVLVGLGKLNPFGVFMAGALGGSGGDQFYFYVLRGRLRNFLDRFPSIAKQGQTITRQVQTHAVWMVLASRFLPGLRIAIPAACAYTGVPALQFSLCSLISGIAWAGLVLVLVAWGGPSAIACLGLTGWWSAVLPACLLALLFRWFSRVTRTEDTSL